jgi:DNA modification methylase
MGVDVMEPTWKSPDGDVRLYLGDSLAVLPTLADASVDCIVTDPPYGHNNNNGDLIHRWLVR